MRVEEWQNIPFPYTQKMPRKKVGRLKSRSQVYPPGLPTKPKRQYVVYDDPPIIQSLRFQATDRDRARQLAAVPVMDV